MTTKTTTFQKPRNPWVAAAHRRHAGRHGPRAGGRRQAAQRLLAAELGRLDAPRRAQARPPSP